MSIQTNKEREAAFQKVANYIADKLEGDNWFLLSNSNNGDGNVLTTGIGNPSKISEALYYNIYNEDGSVNNDFYNIIMDVVLNMIMDGEDMRKRVMDDIVSHCSIFEITEGAN